MAGFYFGSSSDYIEAISGGTGAASSIFPALDRCVCKYFSIRLRIIISKHCSVKSVNFIFRESEINSLSSDGIVPTSRPKGDITFENVLFSYPSRPTVTVSSLLL